MKLGIQVSILGIAATALLLHAQERGAFNRMEPEKVVKLASSLKPGMTEVEVIEFLKSRGLVCNAAAAGPVPTNQALLWYRFGITTNHLEDLRVTLRPKQDMPFERWKEQHLTNSSFFNAQIYKSDNGNLFLLPPFTNSLRLPTK